MQGGRKGITIVEEIAPNKFITVIIIIIITEIVIA